MGRKKKHFTQDQIAAAKAWYEGGKSINQIAHILNIHFETAKKLVGAKIRTPEQQKTFAETSNSHNKNLNYLLERLIDLPPEELDRALEKISFPQRVTLIAILSDKLQNIYENKGQQKISIENMVSEVQESLDKTRAAKAVLQKIIAQNQKSEIN
jgi:transposase